MEQIETPVNYKRIECKSLLHSFNKKFLPFKWGINPYRGCEHSCPYCFARYTHEYLGYNTGSDFENKILVKINAAEVLQKEFSRSGWKHEVVNLGSVCDPYQPAERKYEITRQILTVFEKFKNPLFIGTKSDLVLRDIDLLSEIADKTQLRVNFTITTLNEKIRQKIEPRAPSTKKRLDAIKKLTEAGIKVDILFMPIFPYLTDDIKNINSVVKAVSKAGAGYIIPGVLNLRSSCRNRVLSLIKKEFPELIHSYLHLYKRAYAPKQYTSKIYKIVENARRKYGCAKSDRSVHQRRQTILETWIEEPKKWV